MSSALDIVFCIVTYKQPDQLARLYASLWQTYGPLSSNNAVIINNHSSFTTPGPARVFHNALRPDQSLGYLSRSWNQAYLHGFQRSVDPATEWVCLVQSDVVFQPGWPERLGHLVNERGCLFVACGPGDQAVFVHIAALRAIGWWDERFCGIGYQEFDYFIRAYLRLGERACIQGHGVQLSHNWRDSNLIARQRELGSGHTSKLNGQLYAHLGDKWGHDTVGQIETPDPVVAAQWTVLLDREYAGRPLPREYNWYPHFFLDDPSDYAALYYGYHPVASAALDIRVHGFGWAEEQRPDLDPGGLRLPWRTRLRRSLMGKR